MGTFLAITTWQNQSSTFDVNTLVRLGNGYAKNSNANYKPVNLHISHFRYSLGPGQFLIDVSDCGDVKLNGKELSDNLDENLGKHKHSHDDDALLVQKCKTFSEFTRKKFWYYLQDAQVVYSTVGSTAERDYCLVTYVNVAGTFFVIGSDAAKTHVCEVNTFVRLGNGYEDDSGANYEAVNFQKVTLPLRDYQDWSIQYHLYHFLLSDQNIPQGKWMNHYNARLIIISILLIYSLTLIFSCEKAFNSFIFSVGFTYAKMNW